jgi:hypothetical protein
VAGGLVWLGAKQPHEGNSRQRALHQKHRRQCGRWCTHLCPSINKAPLSEAEDQEILALQCAMGNSWTAVAKELGTSRTALKIRDRFLAHKGLVTAAGSAARHSGPVGGSKSEWPCRCPWLGLGERAGKPGGRWRGGWGMEVAARETPWPQPAIRNALTWHCLWEF